MRKIIIISMKTIMMALSANAEVVYNSQRIGEYNVGSVMMPKLSDMQMAESGDVLVKMYDNNEGIIFQVLVRERAKQMLVMHQGLNVYVDLGGKKKKKYTIEFPSVYRERKQRGERQATPEEKSFVQRYERDESKREEEIIQNVHRTTVVYKEMLVKIQ